MRKVRVLFVCLGNICRSPLAEGIFRHKIKAGGFDDRFEVDSCGTAAYHVGEAPDSRSVANAKRNGVDYTHAARQLSRDDFYDFDYILPMDESNMRNVGMIKPHDATAEIIKMRDYDSIGTGLDVPDPYYGGERGFQEVFDILNRSTQRLLDDLLRDE